MKSGRRSIQLGTILGLLLLQGVLGSNHILAQGDNPPSVSFTNISDNQILSGIQTIQVSATDPDPGDGIAFVEILYLQGGVTQGEIGIRDKAPYSVDWDTTIIANGTYQLEAMASDFSGNSSNDTVTVQVLNGASNAPSVTPGSLAVLAVIIALGLIGTMIVYRARSRKHLNVPKASATNYSA